MGQSEETGLRLQLLDRPEPAETRMHLPAKNPGVHLYDAPNWALVSGFASSHAGMGLDSGKIQLLKSQETRLIGARGAVDDRTSVILIHSLIQVQQYIPFEVVRAFCWMWSSIPLKWSAAEADAGRDLLVGLSWMHWRPCVAQIRTEA